MAAKKGKKRSKLSGKKLSSTKTLRLDPYKNFKF